MEKAYSYRFYPTPEQESLLRRTLGCVRLVYNKAKLSTKELKPGTKGKKE